jgi:hypothetical protein
LILARYPLQLADSIIASGDHPAQAHRNRRIGRDAQGVPIHQIDDARN